MKKSLIGSVLMLALMAPLSQAQDKSDAPELNMDQLLQEVRQGRQSDAETNRQRVAKFRREQANQRRELDELIAEEQRQEDISDQREAQFEENDLLIG